MLPQGVDVTILSDRTETVRASVEDVEFTLVLTIGLVVAVIFVFLRDLRATVIPGVAVPLSLVGTFGVMYLLGYSLDNLSLMALTISTGFVVDDAIVMIENIARYIEEGEPPFEAALKGSKQIGFTILSLTVSLVAVLIPLLFMGGVVGRLFREFAVTLATAIAVSAVLSLTLTPMMCAHLLRRAGPDRQGRLLPLVGGRLRVDGARLRQGPPVGPQSPADHARGHHRHRGPHGVLAVVIPRASSPAGHRDDRRRLRGLARHLLHAHDGSPARRRRRRHGRSGRRHRRLFIGADGTNATTNSGRLSVALKPRGERKSDAEAIIARLRNKLAAVDGIALYLAVGAGPDHRQPHQPHAVPVHPGGRQRGRAPHLRPADAGRPPGSAAAPRRGQRSAERGPHQLSLTIDRDTASRLGIAPQAIDDALYDAFGQRQVSTIFTQLNLYRVILEVKPELQESPDALAQIYVKSSTGGSGPARAFTTVTRTVGPLSVPHQGQFPSVTLSFDTAPGVALGEAVDAIHAAEAKIGLPPSIRAGFQGTAQALQRLAGERAAPHPGRAHHRLHRPRGALRELHPPRSRSSRRCPPPASGAARAHDLPDRLQHHRAHRHHPAHRHRQEERHHDDRLRPRGGARQGHVAARSRSTRRACCASGPS